MLPQIPPKPIPRPGDRQPPRRPQHIMIQDVRPAPRTRRRIAVIQPAVHPVPTVPTLPARFSTELPVNTTKKPIIQWISAHSLLFIAPLVIFLSIRLSTTPIVGEITLAIYGVIILLLKKPSRLSFWLATMVLVSIGLEFLLLPGDGRANNSALFVFTLLGIGLISMTLENRRMIVQNKPLRRR